jgi:N5-(cytidine 5'-diphosphoramidyl)-L-glutamine hydrolase
MTVQRIGITMRVVEHQQYVEHRDALSHDWTNFISQHFPDAVLIPLLNNPKKIIGWLSKLNLDALILSNGNDWESAADRDETERLIVDYCLNVQIPVLGVCRGLQVINILFGGKLEKDIMSIGKANHVACEHPVHLKYPIFQKLINSDQVIVNSYHNQGVFLEGLAKELQGFATTEEGVVEGLFHPNQPILAIQWHPERKSPSMEFDQQLISRFLQEGAFWHPMLSSDK